MLIAWAGFATIGVFMARYMKLVWGDEKLLGQKVWFTVSHVKNTAKSKEQNIVELCDVI